MLGKTISHYKILEKLGEGGMGIVYLAEDTKLKRKTALKFLPSNTISSEEDKTRFIQEAQAAASLNHPNIATVYGIDEHEGDMFIAMEYVEGQSLKDKIQIGPLKLKEAIEIVIQTAEGLHIAHEKGIVHRDIKAANIMLTKKGQVKIMDFGLAKVTASSIVTKAGTTLGTVGYMSPEQAKGEFVDHRTDIWSLGVVLYEMISGLLPFKGEYETAIIYSIQNVEPEPLTAMRTGVPIPLEQIVAKMLAKDFSTRYQHVDEIPVDLKNVDFNIIKPTIGTNTANTKKGNNLKTRLTQIIPWFLLISLLMTIVFWWKHQESLVKMSVLHLEIGTPTAQRLSKTYGNTIAISHDGKRLVYVGDDNSNRRLYLRELTESESGIKPIRGTEDARSPFFSPDGNNVGFFADGKLRIVSIFGGVPKTLCDASEPGGTWCEDNSIIYANIGLWRIDVNEGKSEQITKAFQFDKKQEQSHRNPQILPDGNAILFTIWHHGNIRVAIYSFKENEYEIIIKDASCATYIKSGHLIYASAGKLYVMPFDAKKLKPTGAPVLLLNDVRIDQRGFAHYCLVDNRLLLYIAGDQEILKKTLVWVTQKGEVEELPFEPDDYNGPRISPNGNRLLLWKGGTRSNIWLYNLERKGKRRLTDETGDEFWSVWMPPKGSRIIFHSSRYGGSALNLHWMRVDSIGSSERISESKYEQPPHSITPDGKYLAYQEFVDYNQNFNHDIWILPLDGERKQYPILQTSANEIHPSFSPDGKWLAYVWNESGRNEVYVQPFPALDSLISISNDGGAEPVWAPDGQKLYYRKNTKLMAATFQIKPSFRVGLPVNVFEGPYLEGQDFGRNYDISHDGEKFIMIKINEPETTTNKINVVINWFEEFKDNVKTVIK